jgi:hypothetical protein
MDYNVETYKLPDAGVDVTVKAADATAEKHLWDNQDNMVVGLPKYWAACTLDLDGKKPDEDAILDLRIVDQRFLAIKICRATKKKPGTQVAELIINAVCPGKKCGKPVTYRKDLDSLDFVPCPEGATLPDPTFELTLPWSNHHIVWGQLTGRQEMEQMETEGFDPARHAWKAIRSVDGDPKIKLATVMAWPLEDHKAIRNDVIKNTWGYDTRVEFTHKCGAKYVVDLLTHPAFMMPGLPG